MSGGHYYYLVDGLGSVVGITNGSGSVVQSYTYDPYGQIESSSGSLGDPWRFAGGYFDGETHFTKFGARYDAQDLARGQTKCPSPAVRGRGWGGGSRPELTLAAAPCAPAPVRATRRGESSR